MAPDTLTALAVIAASMGIGAIGEWVYLAMHPKDKDG
jgi:hypothetical protein